MKHFGNRERGFSLIELVITIVVIGILSAVVMINIGAKAQHSVTVQADEFRRNLSHIQLLAISQGVRLKLTVASGSYTVAACPTAACGVAVTDPATGQNFSVPLTDDVQFTAGVANSPYYFDTIGRPVAGASGAALVTDPTKLSFSLNGVGRATDVTVTMLPITGFAQTAY